MASRGSASVTMADVAASAGVSRALVSIVMRDAPGASPETRARVRHVAAQMGYRPDHRARLLGRTRSRSIGVGFELRGEFHSGFLEHLYAAADATDYELIISPTAPSRSEEASVRALLEYRCESLILVGSRLSSTALDELAAKQPVVVVARSVRSQNVDVVRTDDALGARMAVDHLVELGHQDIAHVHGGTAAGATERRRGYRDAMRRHGLTEHVRLIPGGSLERDGELAARQLIASDMPTAITAFNDSCAAGLMAVLRLQGVAIPRDVSITGFDDAPVAELESVSLTTIAQDTATLAAATLDRAIGRLGGPTIEPHETVIAPRLIMRATTGAA